MRALTEERLDRRWGALVGLVVLAAVIFATGCFTTEAKNVTDDAATLTGQWQCENQGGYSGWWTWQIRDMNRDQIWYDASPHYNYDCPNGSNFQPLPDHRITNLQPDTLYEFRLGGSANNGLWTADSNSADGDQGQYSSFETSTTTDVVLADVGDEGGTDAQAAVAARRAHLVLTWNKGRKNHRPKAYALSYVDQSGPTSFGVNTECRIAMRVWFPSGGGYWDRMYDRKFGAFNCPYPPSGDELRLTGQPDEESSGASARVTFELEPKTKRWRKIRPSSG